jgi:hypothetical protein
MNLNRSQLLELSATYGIPILKALAILVVGWLVAKGVSIGTKKVLDKTAWDNKLAAKISGGRTAGVAIEAGIARFVFWLIMLFVLMAVFQALGLTIITEPINVLLTKIVGFVPQALAALVLAAIAWAVATVLRMAVANLLGAFQIDQKLGEQAGAEMKKVSLASTLADAVYYLVWLLFLPQIIDALGMEGLSPVKDMVGQILGFLPSLFGAAIVFLLFYVVARIVQRLATNLLGGIGFDRVPESMRAAQRPRLCLGHRRLRDPRDPALPRRGPGVQDARARHRLEPRRAAPRRALQHRGGGRDLRSRPLPEPGRLPGDIAERPGPVGPARQRRAGGNPDLHRRHGPVPGRARLADRDPGLRGGDRGLGPRRRARLRPRGTGRGGADDRRVALEELTSRGGAVGLAADGPAHLPPEAGVGACPEQSVPGRPRRRPLT